MTAPTSSPPWTSFPRASETAWLSRREPSLPRASFSIVSTSSKSRSQKRHLGGVAFRSPSRRNVPSQRLLVNHPRALLVFCDAERRHWHLMNVRGIRYRGNAQLRHVLRRFAVVPTTLLSQCPR